MACEDEPSRRLGVEGGDDVVEGDPLPQHRVLLVRNRLHAPAHPSHLVRYVLQKQARYVESQLNQLHFTISSSMRVTDTANAQIVVAIGLGRALHELW